MTLPGYFPRLMLLLLLLLLLTMMVAQQVTQKTLRECLGPNAAMLQCEDGQAILVVQAALGVSEGTTSPSTICPKTSDNCHKFAPKIADLCNRKQTCSLAYPRDTVINVFDGCGLTNYIEATYRCVQISTVISMCGWSGERDAATSYIVNNNYPLTMQPQPHRCQCNIQRPPDSTALQTGVALIVRDAYFTGINCQQKLYVEFPGHSTQSNTVCSGSQIATRRTIFSRASIQSGEIITLTFDKSVYKGDAGSFVIEIQVTGLVSIKCTTTTISAPTPPTTSTTSTSSLTTSKTFKQTPTTADGLLVTSSGVASRAATEYAGSSHSTVATPQSSTDSDINEFSTAPHRSNSTQTDIFAAGLGAGLGFGLVVVLGVSIVCIIIHRRRLKSLTKDDTNMSRTESQAAPRATEIPLEPNLGQQTDAEDNTTASNGQYEPLQGVTTSTPVTYENVQASNYESLDVPHAEADGAGLPVATYEVVHPTTQPKEGNYVNY